MRQFYLMCTDWYQAPYDKGIIATLISYCKVGDVAAGFGLSILEHVSNNSIQKYVIYIILIWFL